MPPEPKTCQSCGRTIEWRKKWERDWDQVRYCSTACRKRGVSDVDRRLEESILDLLAQRVHAGEHERIHDFITMLRDHMDKEDNGLFPAAAIELDGPDWEEALALTPLAADGAPDHGHAHGAEHSH